MLAGKERAVLGCGNLIPPAHDVQILVSGQACSST
jgi:hypothetical protein